MSLPDPKLSFGARERTGEIEQSSVTWRLADDLFRAVSLPWHPDLLSSGPSLTFRLDQVSGDRSSVRDHMDRLADYIEQMSRWLEDGRIQYRENIVKGLEHAPDALIDLLAGKNLGKQILQIGDDPSRS